MHHVGVAFHDRVVGDLDRAGQADAAEVVTGEVDEHQVLGAFLRIGEQFGFELAVGGFVGAARTRAGDRTDLAEAAGEADVHFRRGADDVEPAARLQDEHVRRRVHVAQHAVEVEGVALEGDVGAAREHDLHAVAGADVFLGATDGGFEVGLAEVGLTRGELSAGREFGGHGGARSGHHGAQGFEFLLGGGPGGVGVGRRFHAGVDDEAQGLAGVVEGDDAVDQHEVEQGRAGRVLGGLGDGRLDTVDVFIADHADHAADERGQSGHLSDAQAGEFLLHQ